MMTSIDDMNIRVIRIIIGCDYGFYSNRAMI